MWIVTGASGFVGGHVVRALGGRARPLHRQQVARWDAEVLRPLVRGATGVVHCASVVHRPGAPEEEYERFNVEGTRALVAAAEQEGVQRFVFLSSIKVYGEAPDGVIDETTPALPEAHYAVTKLRAEEVVMASRLRPIVLRLCPVYGRGDKGNVRTMIRAIHRRRFLVPGSGAARKSIVHVSTVAEVVAAATEREAEGVFVVADRFTPSIRELSDAIARVLGRRRPPGLPLPALLVAADVAGRVARKLGIKTAVSRELIVKATTSTVCDPSRAERELGVRCSVDLDESLADEIAWLRETSVLPHESFLR